MAYVRRTSIEGPDQVRSRAKIKRTHNFKLSVHTLIFVTTYLLLQFLSIAWDTELLTLLSTQEEHFRVVKKE